MQFNIMLAIILGLIVIGVIFLIIANAELTESWESNRSEHFQKRSLVKISKKPDLSLTCSQNNDEYDYTLKINIFHVKPVEGITEVIPAVQFKGREKIYRSQNIGDSFNLDDFTITGSELEPQKKEIIVLSFWKNDNCVEKNKKYGVKGLLSKCEDRFLGSAVHNTTCTQ